MRQFQSTNSLSPHSSNTQSMRIRIPRLEATLNSIQREVLHEEECIPLAQASLSKSSPFKSSSNSKDDYLPDSDDSGATTISYTSTTDITRSQSINLYFNYKSDMDRHTELSQSFLIFSKFCPMPSAPEVFPISICFVWDFVSIFHFQVRYLPLDEIRVLLLVFQVILPVKVWW